MANAEECRWESHQTKKRNRQRVKKHREECRDYGWLDPRGWVCHIVTFFETVWNTVTETVNDWVCDAAELFEEIERYGGMFFDWAMTVLDHWVGVLTGNPTGYWPIVDSEERSVSSRPVRAAFTRSFVLGTDLAQVSLSAPYREEGAHVEVRLVDGSVEWSIDGAPFVAFEPRASDYPPLPGVDVDLAPQSVSYHKERLGEWVTPPVFDMIAAGGDRFIAKAADSDAIYIAIPANPFVHRLSDGSRIQLPQSFFKLDPDCGIAETDRDELLAHVRVPGDNELHPATERFPLFRVMFESRAVYTDIMAAWFAPRIWLKLDTRPRKGSSDPPQRYPQYDHIIYRCNLPDFFLNRKRVRRSVRYRHVLDLGVGVSHFHEQHDGRFGGEADSLSGRGGTLGGALAGLRQMLFQGVEFDHAYRYANGPVEDYGGWVDGTCIYYMLVQLKSSAAIEAADLEDAFAVLWTDEQLVFTERWRVLDIIDRKFMSPFQPIVGDISINEEEFYSNAPFDGDRYFCPFRYGHVRQHSRMAVARQFIAVTGIDPDTNADEIYTTHFAWGTMDKTWRRRLPPNVQIRRTGDSNDNEDLANLSDFSMRGDSTIMIRGARSVDGNRFYGYWTQRVLPANGQEMPSVQDLADEETFEPRRARYTHAWRFVGDGAFKILHRRYSHYGVLEPVESRIQMYRIPDDQITFSSAIGAPDVEAALWEDRNRTLQIQHPRLNYGAAAQGLQGLLDGSPADVTEALEQAQENRTHPSGFNNPMRFKLARRPGLGWILMHADKRDEKLIGFNPLPNGGVLLTDSTNSARTVTVRALRHVRNARDPHGIRIGLEADGVSPPAVPSAVIEVLSDGRTVQQATISFTMGRKPDDRLHNSLESYREWVASNVWRVKLGGVLPDSDTVVLLLDLEREIVFQPSNDNTTWTYIWLPSVAQQRNGALAAMLSEAGAAQYGTSLWFVGATGLAAPPDGVGWCVAGVADPPPATTTDPIDPTDPQPTVDVVIR